MPASSAMHDRARRVALVEDVHRRGEAAPVAGSEDAAAEDVAEELVHLPPHPLEVREEVALRGHGRSLGPRLRGAGRGVRASKAAPSRATSTPPVKARAASPAPTPRRGRRDVGDDQARDARALGELAGLRGREVPEGRRRLRAAQRGLEQQHAGARASSTTASFGAQSAPKTIRPPRLTAQAGT